MVNLGFYTYSLTTLAFIVLTSLMVFSWRGRILGIYIIAASLSTLVWGGVSAAYAATEAVDFRIVHFAELAKNGCWCLFLIKVIESNRAEGSPLKTKIYLISTLPFLMAATALLSDIVIVDSGITGDRWLQELILLLWVVIAIIGLVLVEQIFRHTAPADRWAIKYLCLGIGAFFAYDFYMYSHALLFKAIDQDLWNARGLVNVMVAPLIAVSVARNPRYAIDIHVSRDVIFHSVTVLGAAIYLLAMASIGYAIRSYGGSWGNTMEAGFLFGVVVLLMVILFSDRIRTRLRVFLSKHFFSFKYDYRQQWLDFTHSLAAGDRDLPERVLVSMASLIDSPGGYLWERQDESFQFLKRWNAVEPEGLDESQLASLLKYLEKTHWIIDLDEYAEWPQRYEGLELPSALASLPGAWLVIPLVFTSRVQGFVLLKHSRTSKTLDWEDRDLLKVAGQQAASNLAQYQSDQALLRARQFEAFNRLSAYVVHDLKNILAQQSLILANAEKHKTKPEFIEDVIVTIRSSVHRMTRLMDQMRSGMRGNRPRKVRLNDLLADVVAKYREASPRPVLEADEGPPLSVFADPEQLANVFGHIIQNGVEATDRSGKVVVRLLVRDDHTMVEVEDTGTGMDEDFVRNRLFKPFDSTKGLTGMGIGLFESREYIRSLGGEIRVDSSPGGGTKFSIFLPDNNMEAEEIREFA